MITTELYPDGSFHSLTSDGRPSHDPERMRRPVTVWSILAREGHQLHDVARHRKPEPTAAPSEVE